MGNPSAHPEVEGGTGGLLIIYSKEFNNKGNITSNGVGTASGGGASGGGSINVFSNKIISEGKINAVGGSGMDRRWQRW